MKEKHVFAGNNTSKGFYSYFDNLIKTDEAKHIYILKGGPGVGKSTFMKKIAAKMLEKGYFVEYIHCSSDNESLDGIVIPELNIAFVDGTAPHTIDPVIPGAVDEIVNLGIYLDSYQLEKHKSKIIQLLQKISSLYRSAFRYLEAAGIISEEINSIYDEYVDLQKFNDISNQAINKLFDGSSYSTKTGNMRKLFSESFTASGYINYTPSLCQERKVWAIVGENTNYTSKLLGFIADEALKRGYDAECYYKPLKPEKMQHILIPEMNLMIISSENNMNINYDEVFDLHLIIDSENLKSRITEIENNLNLYDSLIKTALEKLYDTKKLHDLLEVFYVNSMNFKGTDECFENILSQLT
ncbi:MAG: ATPase [Sedimentibacter sp.]|uniref:nSTAND3 domain-containing NTPase n=1 Tax=Sedimentibacter sp. TaxID=1960295 RepID=UPI002982AF3D|nr:ATPase [Sedimentibacter sp.]MDW5300043.1 ATPase [Sedimentibacter sp.]